MSRLRPNYPFFRLSPYGGSALTDCSVDSGILQDSAVSTAGIQDSAITSVKIADCTIVSADIADSTIVGTDIADSAIDSSKLADCAVTYNAIQNVTAQRLLGREDALAGSPQEIALSAELRFDTDNDWVEVADCGILTALFKDSSVDSTKLLDGAVSTLGLADSAVDSSKLADSAVSSAGIQDGTIVAADLADSAIDSGKLADSAVSSAGIQDGTIVAADFYDTHVVTRIVEVHATDTTLAVGDTLATFFVPIELNNFDLVRAEAAVKVVSTTGRPTIQVRDVTGAADMMSVKITMDSGEKTSYTSDTASVVDTTNDTVVTGQEIAIDVDSAGTGTEDLYVILSFRKP